MQVSITKKELSKLIEQTLLEGEVTITPKGRNILGVFLMLAGGALTPLPLVGWVLGPTLAFLAKMGLLEDFVAEYIEGKVDLEKLVNSIENRVMQVLRSAPKGRQVIAYLAKLTAQGDKGGAIRREVEALATQPAEIAERMAAIYVTDAILQMIQKNIKLDKLKIRGKQLKIPGKKLPAGGLIIIDKQDLPSRYQPLHGIVNQVATDSLDSAGEQAFEKAVEIADNDEFDPESFELTGDVEGVPDELPTRFASVTPIDSDIVSENMQDLFDAVDMIAMINEARYSR